MYIGSPVRRLTVTPVPITMPAETAPSEPTQAPTAPVESPADVPALVPA